ncbi:radical SAM protein [Moorella naiadis (nom. illeg.)]|uniref:radical SAM protein n=1 Tax=Moorella naiadis (nom. illeg.) TaxID=3093670 RepID=UPI003D9C9343
MYPALEDCRLCPRACGVNRLAGEKGFCRAGAQPRVALATLHQWEEPCLSGSRGSGAVFFSHCNMRCAFCQNYRISWQGRGREMTAADLAATFLDLQQQGAHNINLVSATPYTPLVAPALRQARNKGLKIPVVYNCNAYESLDSLRSLEGLVDIYLPDLKYADEEPARRYSQTPGYFAAATAAVLEMQRQVGVLTLDTNGLARRGLLIRHLVLPGQVEGACRVLAWVRANLPRETFLSIMAQYVPIWRAEGFPEINRCLTPGEYEQVLDYFDSLGLENGYCQEMEAAAEAYIPSF